jgi:hypothetical protein
LFSSANDHDTGDLALAGTYSLLLEGSSLQSGTASYEFDVSVISTGNPLASNGQPLELGQRVDGALDVAGEEDLYTFTLPAFSHHYFDAIAPAISSDQGFLATLRTYPKTV